MQSRGRAPTSVHGRVGRRRRDSAMFLSDFSIKRPVSTVVIIIALMCLGLLALNKLRVNQIPDVEQPVMVVTIPYPGASPETGRARDRQPHREGAAEHPAGLPDPLDRRREPGADRHHLQLQEEHVEASDEIRNAIATVRYKLPVEMREPILHAHRPVGAADHAARAVVDDADARRDLAPGRGRARRPLPRASTAWPSVNVNGSLHARALGAAARARSCASTTCR